jgi:hypothetical protein
MTKHTSETPITLETAEAVMLQIKKAFGFNISEAQIRKVSMQVGGIDMETEQEFDPASDLIRMIQEGRLEFDEEKRVMRFNLIEPIKGKEDRKFSFFEIGKFTRGMQKQIKIQIKDCNPSTLTDKQLDAIFCAMTSVSDVMAFDGMQTTEFQCMKSIAQLFFS